jgi:hypothetical protein
MRFPLIDYENAKAAFSKKRFKAAVEDLKVNWSILDDTLRTLCIDHPDHKTHNGVSAKVWIIGRTYATQIERMVPSDKGPGSSMSKVVKLLLKNGAKVDGWITGIRKDGPETLDDADIQSYVAAHGQLATLVRSITHKKKSVPRSFVSKYLHFHRPIVPIYDSVAAAALNKLLPWRQAFDCGQLVDEEDELYRQYVMQLRQLNGAAVHAGLSPATRELDEYLLCEADRLFPEVNSV